MILSVSSDERKSEVKVSSYDIFFTLYTLDAFVKRVRTQRMLFTTHSLFCLSISIA